MKILMVLDHEFPSDVRVENEALALINAGHELHLACYTQKNRPPQEFYKGILVHRIPIGSFTYKSSVAALTCPHYFRFWEKFLEKVVIQNSINAIHIHDLPLSRVGKRLKNKFGLALTIDLHENWPAFLRVSTHTNTLLGRILSPNSLWVKYEREILPHANQIIVVVEEARKRVIGLGISEEKISVVSNTLNEDGFKLKPGTPDPNFYTLYYAGGINLHRGLQVVIKALAIAMKDVSNIRFRIAGSGSYQLAIEQLSHQLGVNGNVEFLGHLSLSDVAKNLAMADVALIPHLKTDHTDSTIPHKLFQYMYANKPIVASNCAPIERIIKETNSGVIYRWDSPEDLAQKIVALANKKLSFPPARHWVETKYNWQVDSKVLVDSYNRIPINDHAAGD